MSSAILSKPDEADSVREFMGDSAVSSKIPLPLILGVVGHRDLIDEDKPWLRRQVEYLLDDFTAKYESSRPFQLLCGLAEGADRLVAGIALQKQIELIACLPMEAELYESDFETAESRREFQELLSQAVNIVTLPLVSGNTPENVSKHSDRAEQRRDLQYAALGNYLVHHCQVLIALWDGVDTGLPGGTSSVISRQRHGSFGEVNLHAKNPLAFPETGPVYHILTPRRKNPAPLGDREHWQLLHHSGFKTTGEAQRKYEQLFHRMNAFNKDSAKISHQPARLMTARERLLPTPVRELLPRELKALIDHYVTADVLALSYQRRTRWVLRALIFLFGLTGVLMFELFAHGPEHVRGAFLFAYVGVIVAAYMVYRIANFREVKTRHLDYRALAEGLRLQFFWKLSGLPDLVVDHYLSKQRTELDWIRDAIRRWTEPIATVSVTPNWTTVGKHWLENQFSFFSNTARRNRKWHWIELGCYWTLLMALVLVGVAILVNQWDDLPGFSDAFRRETLTGFSKHSLLAIAMTLLPAGAAGITAYSLKMAFSEQRKQYERMRDLYQRGLICFETAVQNDTLDRDKLIQKVVRELGKEALAENGDWVLLHRERMVEMFVGG